MAYVAKIKRNNAYMFMLNHRPNIDIVATIKRNNAFVFRLNRTLNIDNSYFLFQVPQGLRSQGKKWRWQGPFGTGIGARDQG